jgi:sulfate transport system ATP-binding protein
VVLNQGKIEQTGTPAEVYDNPATPFVFKFLGNVNVFHSRVHEGLASIGGLAVEAPGHNHAVNQAALAYVRPHDIDILRQANGSALPVTVTDIHAIGPTIRLELVRLELERENETETIEAELTRERFLELNLLRGENVFIRPRKLRVF